MRPRLHHTGNSLVITLVPGFTLDDAKQDIPVVNDNRKIMVRAASAFDVLEIRNARIRG
jgi:hypothetical protein